MNTQIELAGIHFKSPILAASTECGAHVEFVRRLSGKPLGGLVTKTFTSNLDHKVRVRPYHFPLRRLGRGYENGDALYSMAAPHVELLDPWLEKVEEMARVCAANGVVLIASFFEEPDRPRMWADHARAFENAGARMIELNFSCPHVARTFARGPEQTDAILGHVKKAVHVPVGIKIGPTLDPLEVFAASWENLGLNFLTAHNAPPGLVIDVEQETPLGVPSTAGYAMGRTFLPYSLARVVRIRRATALPVIGVGGIGEPGDLLQYLLCGTHLAGVGSALYFHGPDLMDRLYGGLVEWMERKGYGCLGDFLGKVFPMVQEPARLASMEKYPHVTPPDCPYVPEVDAEACKKCGRCVRSCIYESLTLERETGDLRVDETRCWSCGFCVGICPEGALRLVDRQKRERTIWENRGIAAPFA